MYLALLQILTTITRLSKLAALRVDLARRGMLLQGVYRHARRLAGHHDDPDPDQQADERYHHEAEAMAAVEPYSATETVKLSSRPSAYHVSFQTEHLPDELVSLCQL